MPPLPIHHRGLVSPPPIGSGSERVRVYVCTHQVAQAARSTATRLSQDAAKQTAAAEAATGRAQGALAAMAVADKRQQQADALLANCRRELEECLALVGDNASGC